MSVVVDSVHLHAKQIQGYGLKAQSRFGSRHEPSCSNTGAGGRRPFGFAGCALHPGSGLRPPAWLSERQTKEGGVRLGSGQATVIDSWVRLEQSLVANEQRPFTAAGTAS